MLGRFSMTINECIQAYEDLIPRIFANPRRLHLKNSFMPFPKYKATQLEDVIKNFVNDRSGRPDTILAQPHNAMCRV